jgi:hypothetical protein
MLQGRLFAYADAHRYRLGTHYEALPVNAPQCPVHHYHKDGSMRFFANNPNPDAYYEPNSFGGPVVERPDVKEPPLKISGDADRYDHRAGNDDYSQPRALFALFDEEQRQRLFANIAEAMGGTAARLSAGNWPIGSRTISRTVTNSWPFWAAIPKAQGVRFIMSGIDKVKNAWLITQVFSCWRCKRNCGRARWRFPLWL